MWSGSLGLDISGSSGPIDIRFEGFDEAQRALDTLASRSTDAVVAALLETGLYLERELKTRTRVDTGRARASWGHFTPGDIRDPTVAAEARAAAHYEGPDRKNLEVTVGTRVVYVPYLNYTLGDLMLEGAMQATISALPGIVRDYMRAI